MKSAKLRALAGALILTTALAGPAAAANVDKSLSESLVVTATTTLTVKNAGGSDITALTYSSIQAGGTASAPAFTAEASSNAAGGVELALVASDLTNGTTTLDKFTQRKFDLTAQQYGVTNASDVTNKMYTEAGTPPRMTLGSGPTAKATVVAKVTVPTGSTAGTYTGTLTVKAIELGG